MKKLYPLLFVFFLIYWSCSDTIPPTVSITSHTSGQTVNEIVPIKVTTQDNEEISKVEFFIDDSLVLTDTEIPYEGYWNTTQYEESSKHIAKVISFDISDNSTESQPISLIIDNSDFYPSPSVLYPLTYSDADIITFVDGQAVKENGYQISWAQNNDDDFGSYKLYESKLEDMMNWTLVYKTDDRKNTTFVLTLDVLKYYQIVVEDLSGLQSKSNILVGDYYLELWGNYYSVLNTDSLDLPYNGLKGSIPSEIAYLTNLTSINLYNNYLTGSIPPEIGNLTNLIHLYLNNNQLTGTIPPEIGNLSNLKKLILGANQLTGSVPSGIWNLTNLTHLSLEYNQLTGSIPSEIGNLTNLNYLYLSNNQLTGEIPKELCGLNINWSSMIDFNLYNNLFCPTYPYCIEGYVGRQVMTNCN